MDLGLIQIAVGGFHRYDCFSVDIKSLYQETSVSVASALLNRITFTDNR